MKVSIEPLVSSIKPLKMIKIAKYVLQLHGPSRNHNGNIEKSINAPSPDASFFGGFAAGAGGPPQGLSPSGARVGVGVRFRATSASGAA
jgi:hypothetical protein